MQLTRRRLLAATGAAAALVIVERASGTLTGVATRAVSAIRPTASGTSATRCAQCGASDHTMLDPRCPMAPRVLG